MGKIHVLDKHIAELIAAGEVVERPSSVIKELVENSIDAKATTITVEIKCGGVSMMKVNDNGSGIAREDIKNAFLRHATSKITTQQDLDSIATLGFRGEALASIAAVSRVELFTRTDEQLAGTHYQINGGEEELFEDTGCAKGMTIFIRDLFYNTPARMKFLKKDVSEANAIAGVLDRIALSHPEISFRFIRDGKEELNTPGNGDVKSAIYAVYGKAFSEGLLPVSYSLNGILVSGFISSPQKVRANRSMQHFFVNGRYVKSKTAMAAVEQAFKGSIMVGKFPSCVLYIKIPFETTDVNVHPAKIEIRFIDERPIFDGVYHAVKSALRTDSGRTELSFETQKTIKKLPIEKMGQTKKNIPIKTMKEHQEGKEGHHFLQNIAYKSEENQKKSRLTCEPQTVSLPEVFVPPRPVTSSHVVKDISSEFIPYQAKLQPSVPLSDVALHESDGSFQEKQPNPFESFFPKREQNQEMRISHSEQITFASNKETKSIRFIGEAFSTYIILEYGEDELLFIDKHAAHERILYEKLKKENTEITAQILLEPVAVTLDKKEYSAVIENLSVFMQAGFQIEDFGAGTVLIRSAPIFLEKEDVSSSVEEMADYLLQNRKELQTEYVDWLYHNIACRAAIKAGMKNSEKELLELVEKLQVHPEIKFCPHGRPVSIVMKKREIEKQFGRM